MRAFLFAQDNAYFRLSLMRVLLGTVSLLLIGLGPYDDYYVKTSSFMFRPEFPLYFFPDLGKWFFVLKAVTLLFSLLFLIGYKTRFSSIGLAISFFLINYYIFSFNQSYSVETNHLVFFLIAMCFAESDRYLTLFKNHKNRDNSNYETMSFLLAFMIIYVAFLYFQAGIVKWIHSGWIWYSSGQTLYIKTIIEGTAFGKFLTKWPWLFSLMSMSTAVFEIGILPFFFIKRFYPWVFLTCLGFHMGTYLVLGISFWFLWFLFPALLIFHNTSPTLLRPRKFASHPIVFFDGHCGLCNWFVNLAISADHQRILRFSPLQGKAAFGKIDPNDINKLDSIILYDDNQSYRQSDAILRILSYLGGAWRLFEISYILPRSIRDFLYHVIARNRYRWFGKTDSCRLPSLEEKKYFLS